MALAALADFLQSERRRAAGLLQRTHLQILSRRPHVEAMSMGLPVISTNWSGITAYLDESVGYPIAVEKLVQIQGGSEVVWWFRGLHWAQPSVTHLRQLMRRVYENRVEAKAKGAAARQLMVEKYSPEAIADILVKEFQRIERLLP